MLTPSVNGSKKSQPSWSLKRPVLSEHQIRNAILDLLRYERYLCWTNNSGAITSLYTDKYGRTKSRFTRFGGIPGASDIFAIQPKTGKFIAIEVKKYQTRNQATQNQRTFIDEVNRTGGIGMIAWSVEMVAQKLNIPLLF